jgi:hypothetical protein
MRFRPVEVPARPPLGMPIESRLAFYPRFLAEVVSKQARWLWLWGRQYRLYRSIKGDPQRKAYLDQALTPVVDDDEDGREMFGTVEAKAYVARAKRLEDVRAGAA